MSSIRVVPFSRSAPGRFFSTSGDGLLSFARPTANRPVARPLVPPGVSDAQQIRCFLLRPLIVRLSSRRETFNRLQSIDRFRRGRSLAFRSVDCGRDKNTKQKAQP